jgi:predicted MFS family arabinose efflux permease
MALAIVGATSFVWQGVFNFYELYMQSKGLSDRAAGTMLTVVFAAGIPAFYFGGDLADRLPYVPYMLGIVGTFAASLFLLTRVESLLALVVLTGVVGFVVHALFPAIDTFMLDTLPDSTRGSAYAAFSSAWMLSQALGSSALGSVVERGYAYDSVFASAALVLGASVVVLAGLERAGQLPS